MPIKLKCPSCDKAEGLCRVVSTDSYNITCACGYTADWKWGEPAVSQNNRHYAFIKRFLEEYL